MGVICGVCSGYDGCSVTGVQDTIMCAACRGCGRRVQCMACVRASCVACYALCAVGTLCVGVSFVQWGRRAWHKGIHIWPEGCSVWWVVQCMAGGV